MPTGVRPKEVTLTSGGIALNMQTVPEGVSQQEFERPGVLGEATEEIPSCASEWYGKKGFACSLYSC